jgi:hypothetical protein
MQSSHRSQRRVPTAPREAHIDYGSQRQRTAVRAYADLFPDGLELVALEQARESTAD